MLDQNSHEPLHAAEGSAVDHDRAVGAVVGAGVMDLEAFGQDVIELHGAELPLAPYDIADQEVDLRPLESPLTSRLDEVPLHLGEDLTDFLLGLEADLLVACKFGTVGVVL